MTRDRKTPAEAERLATGPGTTRPYIFERALSRYLRTEAKRGARGSRSRREVHEVIDGRSVDVVEDEIGIAEVHED